MEAMDDQEWSSSGRVTEIKSYSKASRRNGESVSEQWGGIPQCRWPFSGPHIQNIITKCSCLFPITTFSLHKINSYKEDLIS